MIIYSIATETSLRAMLLAGVFPGLLLSVFLAVAVVAYVRVKPSAAPPSTTYSLAERFASLKPIWLGVLVIGVLVVLLYGGVATPTEIGAVGAVLIGLVGVGRGRIRFTQLILATQNTLRTTCLIFFIIIGAGIFGFYLTLSRLPQNLVLWITDAGLNRWVVIAMICVGYLVLSMFMDENPLLLITLPLTFPLVIALGFDPVWYGIVTLMLAAIGLICPPVGMSAFVVASAARLPVDTVYRGTLLLMAPMVACLILIVAFPSISTWLPVTLAP